MFQGVISGVFVFIKIISIHFRQFNFLSLIKMQPYPNNIVIKS